MENKYWYKFLQRLITAVVILSFLSHDTAFALQQKSIFDKSSADKSALAQARGAGELVGSGILPTKAEALGSEELWRELAKHLPPERLAQLQEQSRKKQEFLDYLVENWATLPEIVRDLFLRKYSTDLNRALGKKSIRLFGDAEKGFKHGSLTKGEKAYLKTFLFPEIQKTFERLAEERGERIPENDMIKKISENLLRLYEGSLRELADTGIISENAFSGLLNRVHFDVWPLAQTLFGMLVTYQKAGISKSEQKKLFARFITWKRLDEFKKFANEFVSKNLGKDGIARSDVVGLLYKYTWAEKTPEQALEIAKTLKDKYRGKISNDDIISFVSTYDDPLQKMEEKMKIAERLFSAHSTLRIKPARDKAGQAQRDEHDLVLVDIPFSDIWWFAVKYKENEVEEKLRSVLAVVENYTMQGLDYSTAMKTVQTYGADDAIPKLDELIRTKTVLGKPVSGRGVPGRPSPQVMQREETVNPSGAEALGSDELWRKLTGHLSPAKINEIRGKARKRQGLLDYLVENWADFTKIVRGLFLKEFGGELAKTKFSQSKFEIPRNVENEKEAWQYLFENKNNAREFLKIASFLRLIYGYEINMNDPRPPFQYALEKGISFNIGRNLYMTPVTESFRRHIIFAKDEEGNILFKFEVLIPGEDEDRREIDADKRFQIASEINERFPDKRYCEVPLYKKAFPAGSYELYGRQIQFTEETPLQIMAFSYEDGKRLWNIDPAIMCEIAERTRVPVEKLELSIIKQVADLTVMTHAIGYVGNDGEEYMDHHVGNFRIIVDAQGVRIKLVGDFGNFMQSGAKFARADDILVVVNGLDGLFPSIGSRVIRHFFRASTRRWNRWRSNTRKIPAEKAKKGGDGHIRQGTESEKEFRAQIAEIRKNDITERFGRRLHGLLNNPNMTPDVRRTAQNALDNYKIYGFSGIVKGEEDYFLGWNNAETRELFIAEDLISELGARGPPSLVDEYLLHEILCPALGHYKAIELQQKLFPEHYTEQALKKHPKGLLGKELRDYINSMVDFRRTMDLAHAVNLDPVKNYLMGSYYVNYLMAVKRTVNPEVTPHPNPLPIGERMCEAQVRGKNTITEGLHPESKLFVGVYGGAGADVSNFLLSTNATEGYFVDNGYGGSEKELTKDKRLAYLVHKRTFGYSPEGIVRDYYFSLILLELEAMGVSQQDMDRIEKQKDEYTREKGNIIIEFDWKYPGETDARKRTIHLVRADITAVADYPRFLNDALDAGIDFYYQKAGVAIPQNYGLFIQKIVDSLKQGGFLITDDILPDIGVSFDPLSFLREGQMVKFPSTGDLKYWENALNFWKDTSSPSFSYGRFVSLYKKVQGGKQTKDGGNSTSTSTAAPQVMQREEPITIPAILALIQQNRINFRDAAEIKVETESTGYRGLNDSFFLFVMSLSIIVYLSWGGNFLFVYPIYILCGIIFHHINCLLFDYQLGKKTVFADIFNIGKYIEIVSPIDLIQILALPITGLEGGIPPRTMSNRRFVNIIGNNLFVFVLGNFFLTVFFTMGGILTWPLIKDLRLLGISYTAAFCGYYLACKKSIPEKVDISSRIEIKGDSRFAKIVSRSWQEVFGPVINTAPRAIRNEFIDLVLDNDANRRVPVFAAKVRGLPTAVRYFIPAESVTSGMKHIFREKDIDFTRGVVLIGIDETFAEYIEDNIKEDNQSGMLWLLAERIFGHELAERRLHTIEHEAKIVKFNRMVEHRMRKIPKILRQVHNITHVVPYTEQAGRLTEWQDVFGTREHFRWLKGYESVKKYLGEAMERLRMEDNNSSPMAGLGNKGARGGLTRRDFLGLFSAGIFGLFAFWGKNASAGLVIDDTNFTRGDYKRFTRVWRIIMGHLNPKDREMILGETKQLSRLQKIAPEDYVGREENSRFRLREVDAHSATFTLHFPDGRTKHVIAIHPEAFTDDAHLLTDLNHELQMLLIRMRREISYDVPQNTVEILGAERAIDILRRIVKDPTTNRDIPELVRSLRDVYIPEELKLLELWKTPYKVQKPAEKIKKGGDGFIRQGAESEKEFKTRIAQIKKNDITEKYRERIGRIIEMADRLVPPRGSPFQPPPRSHQPILSTYKIYGFSGIVKGKDDFFLGWNNTDGNELFIAEDLITELYTCGPPSLVDEYLLHEILCPTLGHYPAMEIQRILFPDHYKPEALSKHPKGLLGEALRVFINERAPFGSIRRLIRIVKNVRRIDPRPVKNGLLNLAFVIDDMAVKNIINLFNKPLVGVYGGAGADISNFLLSTNATGGYFVDTGYEGKDNINDDALVDVYKTGKKWHGFGLPRCSGGAYFDCIVAELESIGVSVSDIAKIKAQKLEYIRSGGNITIEFEWGYYGQRPKKRVIHLVNADITDPENYPDSLKNALKGGIDFYYQRAGLSIPSKYGNFIATIAKSLNPDGLLLLDNVSIGSMAYVERDPLTYLNGMPIIKVERRPENILWQYIKGTSLKDYGRDIQIYRKLPVADPAKIANMGELPAKAERLSGWRSLLKRFGVIGSFMFVFLGIAPPAFASDGVLLDLFLSDLNLAGLKALMIVGFPLVCCGFFYIIQKWEWWRTAFNLDETTELKIKHIPGMLFITTLLIGVVKYSGVLGMEFPVIIGITFYYIAKVYIDVIQNKIEEKKSVYYKPALLSLILTLVTYFNSNVMHGFLKKLNYLVLNFFPNYLNDFLAVPLFVLLTPILASISIVGIRMGIDLFSNYERETFLEDMRKIVRLTFGRFLLAAVFTWAVLLTLVCEVIGYTSTPDFWDAVMYFAGGLLFVPVMREKSVGTRDQTPKEPGVPKQVVVAVPPSSSVISFEQADVRELDKITAVHNTAWKGNEPLQFTREQVQNLIQRNLGYVLKVNGVIRGVLFVHLLHTDGDLSRVEDLPLWTRMVSGEKDTDADTVLFWAIGTVVPDDTVKDLGKVFIEMAKQYLKDIPYAATYSPVKGYEKFVEELKAHGLSDEIIDEYGIYLYLVSFEEGGYEPYLSYILANDFIPPEKFFKREKGKKLRDLVERFHVGKNGAVIAKILRPKEGCTRPDAPYTMMYGYRGFRSEAVGFERLVNFRRDTEIVKPAATTTEGGAIGKFENVRIVAVRDVGEERVSIAVQVKRIGQEEKENIILFGKKRPAVDLKDFRRTGIKAIDDALSKAFGFVQDDSQSYVVEMDDNDYGIDGLSSVFSNKPFIGINKLYFSNPVAQFHELAHFANIMRELSLTKVLESVKDKAKYEARVGKYYPRVEPPGMVKFHYALRALQKQLFPGEDKVLSSLIKNLKRDSSEKEGEGVEIVGGIKAGARMEYYGQYVGTRDSVGSTFEATFDYCETVRGFNTVNNKQATIIGPGHSIVEIMKMLARCPNLERLNVVDAYGPNVANLKQELDGLPEEIKRSLRICDRVKLYHSDSEDLIRLLGRESQGIVYTMGVFERSQFKDGQKAQRIYGEIVDCLMPGGIAIIETNLIIPQRNDIEIVDVNELGVHVIRKKHYSVFGDIDDLYEKIPEGYRCFISKDELKNILLNDKLPDNLPNLLELMLKTDYCEYLDVIKDIGIAIEEAVKGMELPENKVAHIVQVILTRYTAYRIKEKNRERGGAGEEDACVNGSV